MLPDFNRLRVFHFVIKSGGVGAAAKQLHVTQSAVSQNLQKLEEEIGSPLFTRLPNRLLPNENAIRLNTVIEPFVSRLAEEMVAIDRGRSQPFGTLRIGAPVVFGVHLLPQVIASFRRKYPGVSFQLQLGHPADLLPQFEEGKLDLAFADIFSEHPERRREFALFSVEHIMDEELLLVCSRKYHKNVMENDTSFSTLADADFVAYRKDGAALRTWFRYHYRKTPRPLRVAVTIESVQGVVAAIKENMGLGVVPSHVVERELANGRLVRVTNRKKDLSHPISLVRLLDKVPALAEKKFIGHVKASMLR